MSPSYSTRSYGLAVTEDIGVPHADAEGTTEDQIRAVVIEFYRRARRDDRLGPVFETHVHGWDEHLARMTDFWSAALLRTGRYSRRPVERHRAISGLSLGDFDRWVELFEATVRDLCPDREAEAFLVRARRMRDGLTYRPRRRSHPSWPGSGPLERSGNIPTDSLFLISILFAYHEEGRPMMTARESVIVSGGACSCCSAPIVQVHHRDYPEAVAEGMSVTTAAENLANELTRSLDHALDRERREAIGRALTKVRDFLTHHDPAPRTSGGGGAEGGSATAISTR